VHGNPEREGAEMNANPSPGNNPVGLTTILEKSLGAMANAGITNLVEEVKYPEAVTKKGFVFMDLPGYDAGGGDRAGGRRRQPGLLHHRSWQRVRLQARALDQTRYQLETTWTSIAAPFSMARKPCRNAVSASSN
jgi:hypothetical protein